MLLTVLHRLRDHGNTVVVIEHNLDVIKTADWIIDLGPEGGAGGGTIVAEGTPESVAAVAGSYTAHYLKPVLAADAKRRGKAAPEVLRARRAGRKCRAIFWRDSGTRHWGLLRPKPASRSSPEQPFDEAGQLKSVARTA